MTIETKKAENAANAVAILGELNFRNVEFVYHGENYSNDYKIAYRHFDGINADGNGTCFALIEIVIDGKLDTVRFINTYRETAVDIKIGDANCNVGAKGEIKLIDEPATVEAEADTVANEAKAEIKIETKISANGTANVYVNGKRTSNDKAVKIAEANGLPTYRAVCYTYSQSNNSIDETLATALSAYKWLVRKGKGNRNVADGSWEIERLTDHKVIYEIDERDEKINADDEPEFATFIYAENGAIHIADQLYEMQSQITFLVNDGLTEEQAEQIILARCLNQKTTQMVKDFKAANGIVEESPAEKARRAEERAGVDTKGEFGITVIGNNGVKVNVRPDCKIVAVHNELFVATNILGIYDTSAEAEQAAKDLKAAIQNGAGEYHINAYEVDAEIELAAENHIAEQFKAVRKFAEKLIGGQGLTEEQANAVIVHFYAENGNAESVKKLIDDFKAANFKEAQEVAARLEEIIAEEDARRAEIELAANTVEAEDDEVKTVEIETPTTVAEPEIAKFEVGKRYRISPRNVRTITVLKRNPTTIDFCLNGNESKIIRRKIFTDSCYSHDAESVAYGSSKSPDYFWVVAKDVVDDAEIEQVADTVAEIDAAEYAISEDAFNFAVEYEIEEAAIVAGLERSRARILANETLKIRYDKAKTQVKYERYENGYRGWYFKGKHSDKWEHDETKAAACLTRYGLSRFEFSILSEDENAVIENAGYDETVFELLPTVDELNDVDDAAETYTLTIYTDVWIDGDNTLVKNYDTCRHLHISGKYLISKHSWKLTRGGKTIATGDGVKDFCHFITCEFDVSERFAEIAGAKGATLEICGENIWFRNGKCIFVHSPKYHASFYVEAGIDGNEHYEIIKSDERGNFSRFEFVTEEEFFNTLERRGGCTVDNGEVEYMGDAQAILNDERNQLIRQRTNLNSRLRNGLLTVDEFKADAGEVDAAIRYVELQIDALKAGDTFNYAAAAEHLKNIYGNVLGCIDDWKLEHGLSLEQCEQIYVAAHIDRNFDTDVDRELINRMIDEFKCANAEKFYRETESTFREMKSAVAPARKFMREHIFDIYHFDYVLTIFNQRGELKAYPNKFHLVDTRFDIEVDRCELDYVIYFGNTELARYRTVENVNRAVDQLAIAIANRQFAFTFPEDAIDPIEQLARGIERMRELGELDSTIDSANEKARIC